MLNEKCLARHSGDWAIEPNWFRVAIKQVEGNHWRILSSEEIEASTDRQSSYSIGGDGIVVIEVSGPMIKGGSKYGGANTLALRKAIRASVQDPAVEGIMLLVDSPGGTVAGTDELAQDVATAATIKPLHAHIDDLGASAAYWVSSQASRVSATRTSEIGSIGTLAVIEDVSEAAATKGIKVHVVSTGPFKGAGVPGTAITDEHIAYLQERVNQLNEHFTTSVARGRGKHVTTVKEKWGDGKVWLAAQAQEMGLIDNVESFDDAMTMLRRDVRKERQAKKNKTMAAILTCENKLKGN
jgi:signal peptide peptidase SppA